MKKLLILLLVLGIASAASAAMPVTDDFEGKTVGALLDQGGGTGFSAVWNPVESVDVLQETGNKYIRFNGTGGTEDAYRPITGFTADDYRMTYSHRWTNDISEWQNATSQISLYNNGSGADPIHIKYEGGSNGQWFRIGNENMLHLTTVHNETTAGTWGGGAEADYWKDPVGNDWVKVQLDVDADAAVKSDGIAVYWEKNDGSMGLLGLGTIQVGNETTVLDQLKLNIKCDTDMTFDVDDLSIVPEPATIMMLGLGGLALIRRKR